MAGTLSCFLDEAGEDRGKGRYARYYLVTLVIHDQSKRISDHLEAYEQHILNKGLPDIAFHMVDLLHGQGDYRNVDIASRNRLLESFAKLVRMLPIEYETFVYARWEFPTVKALSARIRRDLVDFIYEHLAEFQSFDTVAIYYDGGQAALDQAVHAAFDYMLSTNTAEYKNLRYQERRLAQVADYLCSIELANLRYAEGDVSKTYRRFFGGRRTFRANYLKQARRKCLHVKDGHS